MIDITPFLDVVRRTHNRLLDNYNCRGDLSKWSRMDRLLSHLVGCDDYNAITEEIIVVGRFNRFTDTTINYRKTPRGYIYNTHRSFPECCGCGPVSPWCGYLYDSIDEMIQHAIDDIIRSAPKNLKDTVRKECDKLLKKTQQTDLFGEGLA